MKKCFMLLFCFVLTACGSSKEETIVCKLTKENVNHKVTVNYEGKKVKTVNMTIKHSFDEEAITSFNEKELQDDLEEMYTSEKKQGVKTEVFYNDKKNTAEVEIGINMEELSVDQMQKYHLNEDIDVLTTYILDEQFECKVE